MKKKYNEHIKYFILTLYCIDNNTLKKIEKKLSYKPWEMSYPDIKFLINRYYSRIYDLKGYTITDCK